jgi:hypothetical protein
MQTQSIPQTSFIEEVSVFIKKQKESTKADSSKNVENLFVSPVLENRMLSEVLLSIKYKYYDRNITDHTSYKLRKSYSGYIWPFSSKTAN